MDRVDIDWRAMAANEVRNLTHMADAATSSEEARRINDARWALEWLLNHDLVRSPSEVASMRRGPVAVSTGSQGSGMSHTLAAGYMR